MAGYSKLIDPECSIYNDIEFIRWENEELVFRGDNINTSHWDEIHLSVQRLLAAL